MRIGIMTFHFAHNYGAMLQAYALCTKLNLLGYDARIIDYRLPYIYDGYGKLTMRQLYLIYRDRYCPFLAMLATLKRCLKKKDKKWYRFEDFLDHVQKKTRRIYSGDEINSLDLEAIIYGSDQIWNESLTGGLISCYFGEGVEKTVKKISYAASNGNNTVAPDLWEVFRGLIRNIKSVSVREQGLSDFLLSQNISNTVVLDPVFLLDECQWDKIAIDPAEKDYVLTYSFWEDDAFFRNAWKIAKMLNKKLICFLFEEKKLPVEAMQVYTKGPREFLGYFRNASFVLTNSFHGTAFSILYKKQFYCVTPRKGRERMDSILQQTGLTDRLWNDALGDQLPQDIDYSVVDLKLQRLREQSVDFLLNALS